MSDGPRGRQVAKEVFAGGVWVTSYYLGYSWDEWGSITNPDIAVAKVDMTTLTHFQFALYRPGGQTIGGIPRTAGTVVEGAGTGHVKVEQPLINKAHAAHRKAIMMLGGAGNGTGWVNSTVDAAMRATFITNILDKCEEKDYDGVDIDWEENLGTEQYQNQCLALLGELRTAADARARWQYPNDPFEITFPGFGLNLNNPTVASWKVTAASLVDQYNLMTYQQNFSDSGWATWFFSALQGHGSSTPTSIKGSVDAYVAAGISRSRIGMGIGLYASGYSATTPVNGMREAPFTMISTDDDVDTWAKFYNGGYGNYPGFNMHEAGVHINVATQEEVTTEYVWDESARTGYFLYSPYCATKTHSSNINPKNFRILTLEDQQSIQAKGEWCRGGGCGGTIIWAHNYGWIASRGMNVPMNYVKRAFLTRG